MQDITYTKGSSFFHCLFPVSILRSLEPGEVKHNPAVDLACPTWNLQAPP